MAESENPNGPTLQIIGGTTPLYLAACNGHIEIVKFLVLLTDNPIPNTKDDSNVFGSRRRTYRNCQIFVLIAINIRSLSFFQSHLKMKLIYGD